MKRIALVAVAGIAVVAAFVACDDDSRYVYTARRFDEAKGCLDNYTPVERVPGEGVSVRCPEACLTVKDVVYVSVVCPPLPDIAKELPSSDPRCRAALEASKNGTLCEATEEEEGDGGDTDGGEEEEDDASSNDGDAGLVEDAAEEG